MTNVVASSVEITNKQMKPSEPFCAPSTPMVVRQDLFAAGSPERAARRV
jgi:hypothetical protein